MKLAFAGLIVAIVGMTAAHTIPKAVAEVNRVMNPHCDAVKCVMPIGYDYANK